MQKHHYIYSFCYDNHESELSKLESRSIFNTEDKNKSLYSDIKVNPSNSAFIRKRLEITLLSKDYNALLNKIKKESLSEEGFKVEYIVYDGDTTEYPKRLTKLKDIGYIIEGIPNYQKPTITYGLGYYEGMWCFGILTKTKLEWKKHQKKPRSYSNSINIHIAKSLVNIASKANKNASLIDACCGVGTVMLEACFAGYKIDGCEINWKLCHDARTNLAHFNYNATVHRSDIKDINQTYDAAIIDLPYNLLSTATDVDTLHILSSAANISNRLIVVSTLDISKLIGSIGLELTDYCCVGKSGKRNFERKIWVCEKHPG